MVVAMIDDVSAAPDGVSKGGIRYIFSYEFLHFSTLFHT